jgi:alanine dehydrogenase
VIIGVPKEIKIGENRVGATPAGVNTLTKSGHEVLVEEGAGEGSGFSDREYQDAGGVLVSSSSEVWNADLLLKIKEPVSPELKMLHKDLLLFSFLHLANPELGELTRTLIDKKVAAIAYETVRMPDGRLPLLEPMSEVAGKMAIQVAAHFLEKNHGGEGILLGGVLGVRPCKVVVIGAGVVGWNAAQVALGMGANVTVLDVKVEKLRHINESLGTAHRGSLVTLYSNPHNLSEALKYADVVVGAILTPGARAPTLVSRGIVRTMKQGSVIVDVAIDQGGIFETSHSTTHNDPVYTEEGVLHYGVTNMPAAVPRTSTFALTNVTLPYAVELADLGFLEAVKKNSEFAEGVNVYAGYVTNKGVAVAHELEYRPIEELL